MTAVNRHRYDTDIPDTLAQGVVVGDGPMGTQLQAAEPTLDDFNDRHRRGQERNTFGCKLVNLDNYLVADRIRERSIAAMGWASKRRVTT